MSNVKVGDIAKIINIPGIDPRNVGKQCFVAAPSPSCEECGAVMWSVEMLEPAHAKRSIDVIFFKFEEEKRVEPGARLVCHDLCLRRIDGPEDEIPVPPIELIKPLEYT